MLNKWNILRAFSIIALASLGCVESLHAQAGGAAVPFLLISPNARANAMGDVGTGVADDIYAIHWNTAGLAFQEKRQIAVSYSRWLPQFNADLDYGQATYGQYVESLGGYVAANFIFMNLGEFTRTFDNGEERGKFRSNEFAIGAAYATYLDDADELGVGVKFQYIQSNLAGVQADGSGTGRSFGVDLGFLWRPMELDVLGLDLGNRLSLGFNLMNVGPKVTYNQVADPLPTMVRLGTSVNLVRDEFNELTFAFDVAKLLVKNDSTGSDPVPISFVTGWRNPGLETSLGLEYWYERVVALRAGFFSEPSRLGARQFFTFGLGVRYDIFNIDFSFINPTEQNHPLANTLRFTLVADI